MRRWVAAAAVFGLAWFPGTGRAGASSGVRVAHCTRDDGTGVHSYDAPHQVQATFLDPVVTGQPVRIRYDVGPIGAGGTGSYVPGAPGRFGARLTMTVSDGANLSDVLLEALGPGGAALPNTFTVTPTSPPGAPFAIGWKSFSSIALQGSAEVLLSCTATDTAPVARATIGGGVMTCLGQPVTIMGGDGPDAIVGTPGDDVIAGLGGDDWIDGGGGNDRICGGDGNDWISDAHAPTGVVVDLGTGLASGGAGADRLRDVEFVEGSGFDDVLSGNARPNVIVGGPGDDTVNGRAGADLLDGGVGTDVVDGGADADWCIRGETLRRCP